MRPKKRLGQHFLMDRGIAARIAALAADRPGLRILEVGAGTGALTEALLALDARVTAFDVDAALVDILQTRPELAQAAIVQADALAYDYDAYAEGGAWRVAGNLPYNIATPLLLMLSERAQPPERIVAMIQRDVANRLTARPSTPEYGSLTLAVALTMRVSRAFVVGPAHFFPRPNVDSAVVVLDRLEQPSVRARDIAYVRQVVRAAFAYRRKTLANSLKLALAIPRERTALALRSLGLDPEIRGEDLDLASFAALSDALGS
ncbi:MAG TPA: 16S rRNA (adenine(1518)-N(6)/adenine(1519)-N(6))-dimethyltransferase RsmA [Candidatus Binatia bacterium]|nr:16S rRNA (adenine(1518)-N(6)/adenine(1519)-N(6))-dimethyltransferase RsmA [Candidatus Binatia bacterium]